MTIAIRRLKPEDFDQADQVMRAAFARSWSFLPVLRLHQAIEPEGLWVAVEHGQIVGTVAAIDYGQLAYLGMMTVRPDRQGQGIGRKLMNEVLAWLDGRGCPIVLLDATDRGARLYERLGFVVDAQAVVFEPARPIVPSHDGASVRVAADHDLEPIIAFDRPRFGADRTRLLTAIWHEHRPRCLMAVDPQGELAGYLIARESVLGPWVARDPRTAEALLATALAKPPEHYPHVLVPRSNDNGAALMTRVGYREQRRLRHMRRGGERPPGQGDQLYGQFSFGHG